MSQIPLVLLVQAVKGISDTFSDTFGGVTGYAGIMGLSHDVQNDDP